jgi:hypothetical protein
MVYPFLNQFRLIRIFLLSASCKSQLFAPSGFFKTTAMYFLVCIIQATYPEHCKYQALGANYEFMNDKAS